MSCKMCNRFSFVSRDPDGRSFSHFYRFVVLTLSATVLSATVLLSKPILYCSLKLIVSLPVSVHCLAGWENKQSGLLAPMEGCFKVDCDVTFPGCSSGQERYGTQTAKQISINCYCIDVQHLNKVTQHFKVDSLSFSLRKVQNVRRITIACRLKNNNK